MNVRRENIVEEGSVQRHKEIYVLILRRRVLPSQLAPKRGWSKGWGGIFRDKLGTVDTMRNTLGLVFQSFVA